MASCSSPRRLRALLVLAVAHALAVAATAPAKTSTGVETPGHELELLPRKYDLAPAAGAGAAVPSAAAGCVKSVLETSRPCARDVLLTLVFGTVRLSEGCCAVLAGAGEKCVVDVFSAVPLGPALLPAVNRICGFVASIG